MKSRIQWLSLGDRNTKFLQISALNKRRKNKILHLQKMDLSWTLDLEQIEAELLTHLKSTFTQDTNILSSSHPLCPTNFPTISPSSHPINLF